MSETVEEAQYREQQHSAGGTLIFPKKNKIKSLYILTCYAILKQDKVLF